MAGMWVAHIDVKDPDAYAEYVKESSRIIPEYDGVFIARGGRYQQKEGKDVPRHVLIRFPTFDRAVECYDSVEYQEIVGRATDAADRTVTIVEIDD